MSVKETTPRADLLGVNAITPKVGRWPQQKAVSDHSETTATPSSLVGLTGFEHCDHLTPVRAGAESGCLTMPLDQTGWLTEFDFGVNTCESVAVIELSEQTIIDQVADRLTEKYPTIPPDAVMAVVQGVHARFDGRPVREYVPLLVERFAGMELDRLSLAACLPVAEATVGRGDEAVEFTSLSALCPNVTA